MMLNYLIRSEPLLDESREVSLVLFFVFVLKHLHVVCNMTTVDVMPKTIAIKFTALRVITNEAFRTGQMRGEEGGRKENQWIIGG